MLDETKLLAAADAARQSIEEFRFLTEGFVRERIRKRLDLDPGIQEELIERIFRKVALALGVYDIQRSENVLAWFLTVVDHATVDYLRAHKYQPESLDAIPEPADETSPRPDTEYRREQVQAILRRALGKVKSPSNRQVLLLIMFAGELGYPGDRDMDSEAIKQLLGLQSCSAAKQLKYRALKEIREILHKMGHGAELLCRTYRGSAP